MNSSRLGLSSVVDDEQQSYEESPMSMAHSASGREKKLSPCRLQTNGYPLFGPRRTLLHSFEEMQARVHNANEKCLLI